tara:strand:+ start:906 stop:1130 length:225 start_codon:yes stop_codon:yes gene_type:complete
MKAEEIEEARQFLIGSLDPLPVTLSKYANQRVVEELEELKEKLIYYQEQVRCSIALATIFGDIDDRLNQNKKDE